MTAKEYLEQYMHLTWDIDRIDRDIERINDEIDSMSINYDGMPRGSGISKKPEDIAVKLSALEAKKQKQRARAVSKREEIVKTIAAVESPSLSKLLYDRYIEFMTWEKIAEDIARSEYWKRDTCSEFWARTEMHSRALEAVEKIINP